MKKIYTYLTHTSAGNALPSLDRAGICYEVRIDATQGDYPYYTFSEICLMDENDYEQALLLIYPDKV